MGNTMTVKFVTSVCISSTSPQLIQNCHKFEQESCTYDTQDIFGGGGGKYTFDTSRSTCQYIMYLSQLTPDACHKFEQENCTYDT